MNLTLAISVFALLFFVFWLILNGLAPRLYHLVVLLSRAIARRLVDRPFFRRVVQPRATKLTAQKAYLPVLAIAIAGAVAGAAAGDGFLNLAELLHRNSSLLQTVDTAAHDEARDLRDPSATTFFTFFTAAGGPVGLAVVAATVAALLAFRRRFDRLTYLAAATGGGALLNLELKTYFARARPSLAEALRSAHGYSFPSGHAMGATVVMSALAYLVIRTTWPWRIKSAIISLQCCFIVAVGLSRIYLGVHWISDIAAGMSAGFFWVVAMTVAYETYRRIRAIRKPEGAAAIARPPEDPRVNS